MRILMLLENNPYPGDRRVFREASALVAAGHDVTVICPRSKGQRFREQLQGVDIWRYPQPPEANTVLGYFFEYAYSLFASSLISIFVLFGKGFDVVHAHNPPDLFVMLGACYKLFGKKFVFDHHDLSPEMYVARFGGSGNRFLVGILEMFEKWSCRLADQVIATNESYRRMEVERSRISEDKVTIVRNGPDASLMQPIAPAPELRAKGKTILGYVGVMGFQDGLDHMLRAFDRLIRELDRRDFFAVIMGSGDAFQSLQELKLSLGLDDNVWFTGRISDEDLRRNLAATDICLDPDPSNPFNDRSSMIKITEYMAFGKPIVAFDLPEHRVSAQGAAVYAQPNCELDFARKIASLMDDHQRREEMGRIGRERVEKQLAWEHQIRHLLSAYDALSTECPSGLLVNRKEN
jgi:glycosyltransferase involved in cell wall biosynthesis